MWKKILVGTLLIIGSIFAQETRFPTNTRYIGGGYINKQPYFNTLEAALNNVKTAATDSTPYLFWIASHPEYITDWATMFDSIRNNYQGKIQFGGYADTIRTLIGDIISDSLDYNWYRYDIAFQGPEVETISLANKPGRFIILNVTVFQGGTTLRYLYKGNANQRVLLLSDHDNQDPLDLSSGGNIILPSGISTITLNNDDMIELFYNSELGKFSVIKPTWINNIIEIVTEDIIDSSNALRESSLNQLTFSEIIDGWYEDDVIYIANHTPMSRGVGRYDNQFDLMGKASLLKLGARVIGSNPNYPAIVYLYKNGYNTGAKVTVAQDEGKTIQTFGDNIVTFTNNDYFDLRYVYEGDDVISIKAFVELENRENDPTFVATDNIDLTVLEVGNGTVQTFQIYEGEVIDSAMTTFTLGDTVMLVARSNAGYNFIGWTGLPLLDESYRLNDTSFIMMTGDLTVRARFRNATQTYKVIISDPMTDADSAHAKAVRTAFLLGNAEESGGSYYVSESEILLFKDSGLNDTTYKIADYYGADVVIRSTGILGGFAETAQKYYPILTFMPAGANTYERKYNMDNESSCMVITGCASGTDPDIDTNITAYDIEWSTYHSSGYSSYSNAYLAGAWYNIMENNIAPTSGWNDWAGLRKIIRNGKVWENKNGYGNYVAFITFDLSHQSNYESTLLLNGNYYYSTIDSYMQR